MKTITFLLLFSSHPLSSALIPIHSSWSNGVTNHIHRHAATLLESSTSFGAAFVDDTSLDKIHHARSRKKWGVDNNNENEYWFDTRIHTLGNSGFGGAVHAACALIATRVIDLKAYSGVDIRAQVAQELAEIVENRKARILDLCCGVGVSTRALRQAFPDSETVLGLDTSPQMIAMADFLTNHLALVEKVLKTKMFMTYTILKKQGRRLTEVVDKIREATFAIANAENTNLPSKSFDLVTVMYAFHEAPQGGRDNILQEARRLLQPGGTLAIVDISTEYQPSKSMLDGEPYVLEYQRNINAQLAAFEGFLEPIYKNLVPGHVGMWVMRRVAT